MIRACLNELQRWPGTAIEMIVLGARSPNKLSAAFLGSVATAVAAKAPCPVVVVRHPRRTGSIVVGVDGSELSEDAMGFAFEEAVRTGQPVKVVHCWQPPEQYGTPSGIAAHLRNTWLVDSLAPYLEKYPTVRVRSSVVSGRASAVLVNLSASASLVVVGSRGRGWPLPR